MQSIPSFSILNDDFEHRRILGKLPDWLVTRWSRLALSWREKMASLLHSVILTDEADLANDPVLSLRSLTAVSNTPATKEKCHSNLVATKKPGCFLCKENHPTRFCKELSKKNDDEKRKFVMRKRLCWRCLRGKHHFRDCKSNFLCSTCKGKHALVLHGITMIVNNDTNANQRKQSNQALKRNVNGAQQSNTVSSGAQTRSSLHPEALSFVPNTLSEPSDSDLSPQTVQTMIHSGTSCLNTVTEVQLSAMTVPLYVSYIDSPHSERLVYAILDAQSEKSFILDETYNALGLHGERIKLSLFIHYVCRRHASTKW